MSTAAEELLTDPDLLAGGFRARATVADHLPRIEAAAIAAAIASPPHGCGFWLSVDGKYPGAAPESWFECAIPDADHAGRDHVLVLVRQAQLESELGHA